MTCTYSVDTFLLEIHSATNFPGADAAMYVFKTAPSSLPASQPPSAKLEINLFALLPVWV